MIEVKSVYEIFFGLILITGSLVIISKNPVISLLYLVLTFLNASIILLIFNNEFLSMLFLVVYIGAIIVLFLFIVMMLNIKIVELNAKIIRYLPIGIIILGIFLLELFYIVSQVLEIKGFNSFYTSNETFHYLDISNFYYLVTTYNNVNAIGQILFTEFLIFLIVISMILLVAMIGAIFLTLNKSSESK